MQNLELKRHNIIKKKKKTSQMEKLTAIFKYSYRHKSKTMHTPHSPPVYVNASSLAQQLARLVPQFDVLQSRYTVNQYYYTI